MGTHHYTLLSVPQDRPCTDQLSYLLYPWFLGVFDKGKVQYLCASRSTITPEFSKLKMCILRQNFYCVVVDYGFRRE